MSEAALPGARGRLRSDSFPAFSLRDLVTALFYYKRITLLAFLVPVALGITAGFLAHTSFMAQARLLVLYGSEYVFHPGNRDVGNDIALDRNQIVQGELQILASPALAAEVLQDVGPDIVYPGLPKGPDALRTAVTRFGQDLVITSIPQSNVLELSLRNAKRDVAIRALKSLISHYLIYRTGVFDTQRGPQGVDTERQQFANRLREAEEKLAQFGMDHGISNLDEQISLQIREKSDNLAQRSLAEQQVDELTARVASLKRQIASVPPTVQVYAESTRSQQSTAATDSLAKLETQRRDLASRYQNDFPLVRDIDRQIAAARSQLASGPAREGNITRNGRNPVFDELQRTEITAEADLRGVEAKSTELDAEATRIQARSDELTGLARQYRDLQRTRDVLDQSYRSIARSSEETALSDALERARGANVRVVQPPDAPLTGRNQRLLLWAGGVVLGLIAAAGVFALLNATRQVFIGVRDVERQLDLPVLLAVPLAPGRRRPKAQGAGRPAAQSRPSYGT